MTRATVLLAAALAWPLPLLAAGWAASPASRSQRREDLIKWLTLRGEQAPEPA